VEKLFAICRMWLDEYNLPKLKALIAENPDLVELLATAADPEKEGTAMHWLALNSRVESMKYLASLGVSFTVLTPKTKMQPLHWACTSPHGLNAIQFLLEEKVDINAVDGHGKTGLMIAAQHNQVETLTLLWSEGGDDALLDSEGDSVLSWACYGGSAEATRFLLCRGEAGVSPTCADPARPDKLGMNAMHLAAVRNAEGVVGALLMHADAQKMCDATDANGKTPHALATARGHAELATTLSEWDPKLLSAPTAWQWWGSLRARASAVHHACEWYGASTNRAINKRFEWVQPYGQSLVRSYFPSVVAVVEGDAPADLTANKASAGRAPNACAR